MFFRGQGIRKWIRIGDLGICCPICGKPDWCRVSKDGGYILCSRVPVYNQKGTVHKIQEPLVIRNGINKDGDYSPSVKSTINWTALNKFYRSNCQFWRLFQYAALKGVLPASFLKLEIGFDGDAYTFPIYNKNFNIVGIQRQFSDGTKSMIKGSKIGIFIPIHFNQHKSSLFITEGVSDCAAGLDLGLNVIGRLNCSTGAEIIKSLVNNWKPQTYIIADNDVHRAGQNGAFKLANDITSMNIKVKVIIPPYKDLRIWKRKEDLTEEDFSNICRKLLNLPP